jgi:Ferritin-like domain
MPYLTVEELDRDGALRESRERLSAVDDPSAHSRRRFLAGVVAASGAVAALARPEQGRAQAGGDVAILNYALTLEYLQADFYTEAERLRALRGEAREAAQVIGAVERAHVQALRAALGSKAVKKPFFDFRGTTEDQDAFLRTAVAFEDLGTAAYKGQAPLIRSSQVLAAAVSIHSVEARHAAWIRYLVSAVPASEAFDAPKTKRETLELVASTRFIVPRPRMRRLRTPATRGKRPMRKLQRALMLIVAPAAAAALVVAALAVSAPEGTTGIGTARQHGSPSALPEAPARDPIGGRRWSRGSRRGRHVDHRPRPRAEEACGEAVDPRRAARAPQQHDGMGRSRCSRGYGTVRTRLVVDIESLTAALFRNGRVVFDAPVGVGASRWPTPTGEFLVRSRLTRFESPFYGLLAFGTSARSES